ncbi:putative phosphatidate cytidylyltransferase [Neonectria ditissima]|uniref:Phosphatidate cytidylyltransferase n=1 Tax=Neonectria ditissima TaxID=78410 RepID=A0A0P7BBT1_9HYPO|nr:putative phosphatidate cytidylyltransferase [Neonectria ditissima]
MGRSKRGVRFPNRNGNQNGSDGRRSSFSDLSDDGQSASKKAQLETVNETLEASPENYGNRADHDTFASQKPPTAAEKQVEYEKKKANFMTRTFWTFVMFGLFFSALLMGHIYIICIITAVQIVSFKEVIAIANVPSRARSLRSTKSLNWYWLATTMYFLYGETVIYYFKHIVLVDKVLLPLATHHRFISFILYVFGWSNPMVSEYACQLIIHAGFVCFVASLQAGNYKFQFTNFAWTHMALYLIVVQAHFIMNNVFEGMIWFFLPAALVITNDIFAYICGILFGRTQLIKLSPKKTVEGFVGAWIMTVLSAIVFVNIMMRSKYFICPVNDLGATIFTGLECDPNPVFHPKTYHMPQFFFLPQPTNFSVTFAPMQLHALNLATFASLIAPFGGFFASGLKRTFKIKDFGDSIPGHGGITDRMDCQFIMGFFAYMYYHSFIALHKVNLGSVLETAITSLSPEEQIELVKSMGRYLGNQGVVPENFVECVDKFLPMRR